MSVIWVSEISSFQCKILYKWFVISISQKKFKKKMKEEKRPIKHLKDWWNTLKIFLHYESKCEKLVEKYLTVQICRIVPALALGDLFCTLNVCTQVLCVDVPYSRIAYLTICFHLKSSVVYLSLPSCMRW